MKGKKEIFNPDLYNIIVYKSFEIIKILSIAKNYNRKKISFVRGKGSYLYTSTGAKYLDFVQGIAVNCLGHANPKLIETINKQSKNFGTYLMLSNSEKS